MSHMVGGGVTLGTGLVRVHAVFGDEETRLNLTQASNHLYDLTSLMWVNYFVNAERPSQWEQDLSPSVYDAVDTRMVDQALHDTQVERISYNSPLDVYLTVSAIMGSVTTVGAGIAFLFNQFQGMRLNKSNTDTKIEQNEYLRELIRVQRRNVDLIPDELVDGAASALVNLSVLEVQND